MRAHSGASASIPTELGPTSFGSWDTFAICPDCGDEYRAAFGSAFHVHISACRGCGRGGVAYWPVKTLRWVGFGRLLRPSTWGVGCWQEHGSPVPTLAEARIADPNNSVGTQPGLPGEVKQSPANQEQGQSE